MSLRMYTASFLTAALTTAPYDIITLLPSTLSRVLIRALDVFAISSDASQESLGLEMWRGSSSTASTGATITPTHIKGHAQAPAAVSVVNGMSTTPLSTASAKLLYAGAVTPNGFRFKAGEHEAFDISDLPQRFHARITAPSTNALPRLAVTLTFQEIGQVPGQ